MADRRRRENLSPLEERVCETILRDTYVDDITTGGDSVDDAFARYKGLNKLLGTAHFKIHKWATNSPELLKRIPEEERAPATENEVDGLLEIDETSSLGIRWDPSTDLFIFKRYSSIGKFNDDTKTAVASLLARPFDPLGLISPFILLAWKILKQMCYGLAIYIYHYTSLYTSARSYHREKYIIGLLASMASRTSL